MRRASDSTLVEQTNSSESARARTKQKAAAATRKKWTIGARERRLGAAAVADGHRTRADMQPERCEA